MSRIGTFSFSTTCELHIVNEWGDSAPAMESADVDVDVTCVLHGDDDGVYAEDIQATLPGYDITLGDEALELLDLSVKAGEVFMESALPLPKKGERFLDKDNLLWIVAGTGKVAEQAAWDVWLERSSIARGRHIMLGRTVQATDFMCDIVNEKGEHIPYYRPIIEDVPPDKGNMVQMHAIYLCPDCGNPLCTIGGHPTGKPCGKSPTKI